MMHSLGSASRPGATPKSGQARSEFEAHLTGAEEGSSGVDRRVAVFPLTGPRRLVHLE
jgi:hypothetical protein